MSDLPSLLPPNAEKIEHDLEQIGTRLHGSAQPLSTLWDPMVCDAQILPWLAWAFSVDDWDPNWSEETKRNVIKESVAIHRVKGTLAAVKHALAAAGYGDASVIERYSWHFYDGTATFDGSLDHKQGDHWAEYRIGLTRPVTIGQANQVRAILRDVAPARSHLKALDFTEALNIYNARILHDGQFTHGVA